jgi:hypothetical protein
MLILLVVSVATPALAEEPATTYPWSPGGDFGSPTYTLPIKVIDGVRSTFINERRRLWRESLDIALSSWGLPFELRHRPEDEQPYVADDDTISTLGVEPLCIPNAIVIVRSHSSAIGDTAGWIEEMGGGIALVTPWRAWWGSGPEARRQRVNVIAHEVGHTLGFGHGGSGVMLGKIKPNDEERALAADYYGV